MLVDHDRFIDWADQHFHQLSIKGYEVKVNDPWWKNDDGLPDNDQKCWINTLKGCYHAFKSERAGNIVEFVMMIEGCEWDAAVEIVGGDNALQSFDEDMTTFLQSEKEKSQNPKQPPVTLPPQTYPITSLDQKDQRRKWAENYLRDRRLDITGLMFCLSGRYKDRIVIPYYDQIGNLTYFNTRTISDKEKVRYLGPKKEEFGVGKGDVLWMSEWPEAESKIYLTEGEFDAISLAQCGLYAGACGGKALSEKQIDMLRRYRIALAFDSDKAGEDIYQIWESMSKLGKTKTGDTYRITLVRPPKQYKDWNKFLIKHDPYTIRGYIASYEDPCDQDTMNTLIIGGPT